MNQGTPTAEVEIDVALVRSLLKSQHPDLANLPIKAAKSGWDNAMFRLGDDLAVRLPRRQLGAKLVLTEQKWLPVIAPQLTMTTPLPVRTGKPSGGYPWHWSIVPWIPGVTADETVLSAGEGIRFAEFLRSLHTLVPTNAPLNPFRGIPFAQRAESTQQCFNSVATSTTLITPTIHQAWQRAITAPVTAESRWLHGDLHPHNILALDGAFTGVIDWGDLTAGDIATDLAAIWMLFSTKHEREGAVAAYGMDEATCWRSQGWAIAFATILLATGLIDNPAHAEIGRKTLRHIEADNEKSITKGKQPTKKATKNR